MSKKKGKSRRELSPNEIRYIEANACLMSISKMASELGRPRSTVGLWAKRVREEGKAVQPSVQKAPRKTAPEGGGDTSDRERLMRLRDMLWDMLQGADEKNAPRLSKEYRETIEAISRLDGGEDDGGSFTAIFAELA